MIVFATAAIATTLAFAGPVQVLNGTAHLRSGDTREWDSFAEAASGDRLWLEFQADENAEEVALVLRQYDVKKPSWTVRVNGRRLGVLQDDERDMVRVLPVPARTLRRGSNTLEIAGEKSGASDDIEIRGIRIEPTPVARLLSEATVSILATGESGPMPVKIAVADAAGSLVPFASLRKGAYEALRTGILYTADGQARIGLPAGEYRVYASRGFEYSAPSQVVRAAAGRTSRVRLRLRREAPIPGYASMDPHVHTLELSRHGDASVDERVLSAAGEGLDYVVATEHNMTADYAAAAARRGLDRWTHFIAGDEVTTAMGHFNIFPARPGSFPHDEKPREWTMFMDALRGDGVRVVVQNHPRDSHLDYRPFDASMHLSSVGANANGRPVRANAMEVVNSGAMASDPMQLVRDWMGLLTRGPGVAGIGSSDTHTVDFSPIGQARTYVRAPAASVAAAVDAIAHGRTMVSYGLAVQVRARADAAEVVVYGPSWSSVDQVELYGNGTLLSRDSFAPISRPGVKWSRLIPLRGRAQDVAVVAVASGPGVLKPFWEVRKPYQPTSKAWTPRVLGVSEAVWLDRDGDRQITPPLAHAERLVREAAGDWDRLIRSLGDFDAAACMQALELLRSGSALTDEVRIAFARASGSVREGYERYRDEVARLRP